MAIVQVLQNIIFKIPEFAALSTVIEIPLLSGLETLNLIVKIL